MFIENKEPALSNYTFSVHTMLVNSDREDN